MIASFELQQHRAASDAAGRNSSASKPAESVNCESITPTQPRRLFPFVSLFRKSFSREKSAMPSPTPATSKVGSLELSEVAPEEDGEGTEWSMARGASDRPSPLVGGAGEVRLRGAPSPSSATLPAPPSKPLRRQPWRALVLPVISIGVFAWFISTSTSLAKRRGGRPSTQNDE